MEAADSTKVVVPGTSYHRTGSPSRPCTMQRNDRVIETTGTYALTSHRSLAWITSDMHKLTRRRVVRSHIMLDYRHKHRLAESRTRRRPTANILPLLARPTRRTNDSRHDPGNFSPANQENYQAHEKSLEARNKFELNNVDLHRKDLNLKYSQTIFQPENGNKKGQKHYQVSRAAEVWPQIDAWSTFATLDKPVLFRMRRHLHYFVNVIIASQHVIRSGTIIRLQEIWPALAQSNPCLLHAIIAATASNLALRHAETIHSDPQDLLQERSLRPHSTDCLFHQAKAIQLINEKLSDPAEACSDATLGAVIFVMCSDMISNQLDKVQIHLKGLQQMINLRGTFESLPFFVSSFIGLIDVKVALICATRPLYPAVRNVSISYPVLGTGADLSIVGSRCLNLEGISGPLSDELNSITSHLCDVTKYTEHHRRAHNLYTSEEGFNDEQRIHIEHRLLSIPFDYHHFYAGDSSIEGCYCLAMLLFINTVLWQGWSRHSNIRRNLVARIKIALESMDLQLFYCSYPDLFIWILFLAGDSSAMPLERAWFTSQLASVTTLSGLGRWKDVRESLLGFFYLDSAHLDAFQLLWAEVQRVVALI